MRNEFTMLDFTVLMSLYKGDIPELFDMALSSILNQTQSALKVVLVVDGPVSAELMDIIYKYETKLPLFVYPLELNIGLASALDYGLSKCTTDWIVRCDSDDFNLPQRFETLVKVITETDNACAVVSSGVAERNMADNQIFAVRSFPAVVKKLKSNLRDPLAHPATALNRRAILSVGGYKGPLFFEDTYLWLRLLKSGYYFINIDKTLVYMSVNPSYFQRRRGFSYSKWELLAFWRFYIEGLIPLSSLPIVILRLSFRMLPNWFVAIVYKRMLR